MEKVEEASEGGVLVPRFAEETDMCIGGSQKEEICIILEKIDRFTQMICEMLEMGKDAFKKMSDEFEERMVMIHGTQIDKWRKEVEELEMLHSSNDDDASRLQEAQLLITTTHPMQS